MTRRPPLPIALDRLLAAILIAFALIGAQMAHAGMPPTIAGMVHGEQAGVGGHAGHQRQVAEGDHAAGPSHAAVPAHGKAMGHSGGATDAKCASHCPAALILPPLAPVLGDWDTASCASVAADDLRGTPVRASERPPKV